MKASEHLIVSIVAFATLAFEFIVNTDILREPYMVGLCLFLGCIGGYNLSATFMKKK